MQNHQNHRSRHNQHNQQNDDSSKELTSYDYPTAPKFSKEAPQLKFQVEVDFGIATLPSDAPDPEPENLLSAHGIIEDADPSQRSLDHVAKNLTSAGFPTNFNYSQSWKAEMIDLPCFSHESEGSDGYRYCELQLRSPSLFLTPLALRSVAGACKVISDNYRIMKNDESWCAGKRATGSKAIVPGFRVFVSGPFPSDAFKNLMAVLWEFEITLEKFHPPCVINTPVTRTLRNHCRLSEEIDSKRADGKTTLTRAEALDKIFECSTIEQTIALTQHSEPFWTELTSLDYNDGQKTVDVQGTHAYQATNFVNASKNIIPSFDFNIQESTTDSQRIQIWIRVCLGLVNFAHRVDSEELRKWLQGHPGTDHGVLSCVGTLHTAMYFDNQKQFLGDMELTPYVFYYFSHLFRDIGLEEDVGEYFEQGPGIFIHDYTVHEDLEDHERAPDPDDDYYAQV